MACGARDAMDSPCLVGFADENGQCIPIAGGTGGKGGTGGSGGIGGFGGIGGTRWFC